MPCCQSGKLHAPDQPVGVRADEKSVWPLAPKRCEGCIDFAAGRSLEDLDLEPHRARRGFRLLHLRLRAFRIGRFTKAATRVIAGTSSCSSPSRFATNSPTRKLTPVRLPPGREKLAASPSWTGSSGIRNTIGMVVVIALAAMVGAVPPVAKMTATFFAQDRQPELAAGRVGSQPSGIRS